MEKTLKDVQLDGDIKLKAGKEKYGKRKRQ